MTNDKQYELTIYSVQCIVLAWSKQVPGQPFRRTNLGKQEELNLEIATMSSIRTELKPFSGVSLATSSTVVLYVATY